ncbi:hypothetical protein ADK67_20895 [Saccharothrix sp. NRRL B-16348]|uniref:DUF1877 family protein n=1 Tax=Saccharothrix sp. NRRL B-16348 TaxID=1415542 RepID=UPI0006AF0811|nr:DUF1877 family protein [Saccharothrix sp. NRRL B-16348]KOX23515.1 hypothetical protein ADK67_20895 [Saccharothrix sp. NRRL B-16348]
MGMTLSFTRVTPEELDRAYDDPEWALECVDDEDRPYCFLEKSWAGIQFLLSAAEVDVDVYEDGDALDDEATLFGWSGSMMAAAAKALSAAPFEVLEGHFDPRKLSEAEVYPMRHMWGDDDLDYLRENYRDLVAFFAETAAVGGAAIRYFSF